MTPQEWRWPELQESYSKHSPSHVEKYGRGYAAFPRKHLLELSLHSPVCIPYRIVCGMAS